MHDRNGKRRWEQAAQSTPESRSAHALSREGNALIAAGLPAPGRLVQRIGSGVHRPSRSGPLRAPTVAIRCGFELFCRARKPVTAARPRRFFTAFPIKSPSMLEPVKLVQCALGAWTPQSWSQCSGNRLARKHVRIRAERGERLRSEGGFPLTLLVRLGSFSVLGVWMRPPGIYGRAVHVVPAHAHARWRTDAVPVGPSKTPAGVVRT